MSARRPWRRLKLQAVYALYVLLGPLLALAIAVALHAPCLLGGCA